MMNHEEIRDLLPLAAAHALSVEESFAVEKHLAACADCRAELESFAAIIADSTTLLPAPTPPWLAQRTAASVRARLEDQGARRWEVLRAIVLGGISWITSLTACWCIHTLAGLTWSLTAITFATYVIASTLCAAWILKEHV